MPGNDFDTSERSVQTNAEEHEVLFMHGLCGDETDESDRVISREAACNAARGQCLHILVRDVVWWNLSRTGCMSFCSIPARLWNALQRKDLFLPFLLYCTWWISRVVQQVRF